MNKLYGMILAAFGGYLLFNNGIFTNSIDSGNESITNTNIGAGDTDATDTTSPRGIRNNNPGNIKYTKSNDWTGQTGSDGTFCIFSEPEYGIRALIKLLNNYFYKKNLTTVRAVIGRWSATDQDAYIDFVADRLNVLPDAEIDFSATIYTLVDSIIIFENGYNPYSVATINRAFSLL